MAGIIRFPGGPTPEIVAAAMPDIMKLTTVGVGIAPPTYDLERTEPNLIAALESLVRIGVADATGEPRARRYSLTPFGWQVYSIVSRQSPSDGSLPANDLDDDIADIGPGPEAA